VRALICLLVLASSAHADHALLVSLAPAADARRAIPIGPAGQVYEPDGKGAWVRRQAGGVAVELVGAASEAGTVFAAARGAPPFKLHAGAWTACNLGLKAKAILGSGPRALAAVGKTVFGLAAAQPTKLADAPEPVLALAASRTGVVIETDHGIARLDGSAFKPVKKAPKKVLALLSDRWALVDRGALDLKTLKTTPWPAGARVTDATVLGDTLVGVAPHGKVIEVFTLKAGKLARDKLPVTSAAPVVGVVADAQGRVVIALRDGTIAIRDGGNWVSTTVRDEIPAAKPGPAPATSD